MLASLDQTVPPKAVPITAMTKGGVSKGSVFADMASLDRTAANVRKG